MNGSAFSASDLTSLARSSMNSSMQIPPKEMIGRFNRQIEQARRQDRLGPLESYSCLAMITSASTNIEAPIAQLNSGLNCGWDGHDFRQ